MSSTKSSGSNETIFTNDLVARHMVIQKAKILKGKSRIMEIRERTGIQLVNQSPYEAQKYIPWNEISEIVPSTKVENEFSIVHGKKNTKNFAIEGNVSRTTVLSDLYSVWKKNLVKGFACDKVDRLSARIPVQLHVNVSSYATSKNGVMSNPTRFENIKKISRVTSEESAFVIHSKQFRKQVFYTSERDAIIQTIVSNASTYLGKSITVDVLNNCDDLFTLSEGNLSQVVYSIIVKKSKGEGSADKREDARKLAIDKRTIYEIDINTKRVISTHRFRQIAFIVRIPNSETKFFIQYHSHCFEYDSPERDDFISSIIELCEREKLIIPVRGRLPLPGCRLGDPELYSKELYEYILKRISTMKKMSERELDTDILEEFLHNFSISNQIAQLSDKKATQFMSDMTSKYSGIQSLSDNDLTILLESFIPVMTLADPFNNFSSLSKNLLKLLYQCLVSRKAYISYLACSTLKMCVDEMHAHKTDKKEASNKLIVLQPDGLNVLFAAFKYGLEHMSTHTLLVSSILSLMENCCISSRSTTDRNTIRTIALNFADYLDHLFDLAYHSKSVPIVYNSLVLARLALQFKACEKSLSSIQTKALKSGHLLQQIYICISTKDPEICTVASDVVAFLVDGCSEASSLLRRIVPKSLLKQLQPHKGIVYPLQKKFFASEKSSSTQQSSLGNAPTNDWYKLFDELTKEFSSFRIIWNSEMKNELLECLSIELNEFERYKREYNDVDVIWNYEEFSVQYSAITSEPCVAGYFIRPLVDSISQNGWTNEDSLISDPQFFIDELHHSIMFSDSVEIKKLCLRASSLLYLRFISRVTYYGLEHICILLKRNMDDYQLVNEILNFLLSVLATDTNAETFIESGGIDYISSLMTLIHQYDSTREETLVFVDISGQCVKILIRLITLHSPVNPDGSLYVPQPNAQYLMCRKETLQRIVQLLLVYEHSDDVYQQTVQLVNLLIAHNSTLVSELYETGLFYFIFMYAGSDIQEAVELLKRAHLLQNCTCEERRTGVSTPDASPIINSILNDLLPKELINQLNKLNSKEFSTLFISDQVKTPSVIWSSDMRNHLRQCISQHLAEFQKALRANRFEQYKFARITPVEYECLKKEVVCSNCYISNFVCTETWPANFALENVEDFASGVTSCLDYLLATNSNLTEQILQYLSMCIRAQLILLKMQTINAYQNYSIPKPLLDILRRSREQKEFSRLLYCLQYQCTVLIMELLKYSRTNVYSFMQHAVCTDLCILLNQSNRKCHSNQVRPFGERAASVQEHFDQRCNPEFKWVKFGDDYALATYNEHEIMIETIDLVLVNLFFLLGSFEDSSSQIAENATIVDDLLLCLQIPERKAPHIVSNAMKILSILCANTSVQDRAFKSGLHIHLLSIIMDCALERTEFNTTVDLAVQCLRRLAGWSRDDSHPFVSCKEFATMIKALEQIFPLHVIQSLCRKPSPSFIDDDLKYPKESPITIWNKQTLQELDMYIQEQKIALQEALFDCQSIFSFAYQTHECELRAAGIFLRLYNNTAGSFVIESQESFVQESGALLRTELTKVDTSKKMDISSYNFTRVVIILEALYIILKQNDTLRRLPSVTSDVIPLLTQILRPEVQYSRAIFYALHILYMLFRSCGLETATSALNAGLVNSIRDLLYCHQFSTGPSEVVTDIHDNLLTLLHSLYYVDTVGQVAAQSISSGIMLYLLASFCDCFKHHDQARVKSSYLLSKLISSQAQAKEIINRIFPQMLVNIIEKNPMDAVSLFEKMHEFPEFIWNQQMRDTAKESIEKWLNTYNTELGKNRNVQCSQYGTITYQYPRQVASIYVQMYNTHPNYPVPNFYEFVKSLMSDIDAVNDEQDREQSAQALHISCGGEYYNKSTVPILADYIDRVTHHLLNGTPMVQTRMLQALSKMSMDNSCLNRFSEHPTFMSDMARAITNLADHQEELIMIVLRVATVNVKIIEQCSSHEDAICALLIDIVNGESHTGVVKELAAKTLKFLTTRSTNLLDKLRESEMYETKIEPLTMLCQDELFTTLIAPPIHPGGVMGYMTINLNKREENEIESRRLFEQMLKQTYYLQKLMTLEQNRTTQAHAQPSQAPPPQLQASSTATAVAATQKAPPVQASPPRTPPSCPPTPPTLPSPPKAPPLILPEINNTSTPLPDTTPSSEEPATETETEHDNNPVIEAPPATSSISSPPTPVEEQDRNDVPEPVVEEPVTQTTAETETVQVDRELDNDTSDYSSSNHDDDGSTANCTPPPPPPPLPPLSLSPLSTDPPAKRFSMNTSLLSDIQKGMSLRSPRDSPRQSLSSSPTPTSPSLGEDLISKLTNRRTHIEDDSGSDSDFE